MGLQVLKKKISIKKKYSEYFIYKYYQPDLQINLTKDLLKFANTSIDISDGLINDLEKMINRQNLSYQLNEDKIPISKVLSNFIKDKKIEKSKLISNGDDYQILFTANINKTRIIKNISKILGVKITKIGTINSSNKKSSIIDQKGKLIRVKNKGYLHQF
jgi:thiamine-monophosphate kinase